MMSTDTAIIEVRLAKEDFKFSSAHFTVFGADDAEPLHGHNYSVAVTVTGTRLDELGMLIDIAVLKAQIRRLCSELDERVLLAADCSHTQIATEGDSTVVLFASRRYSIPTSEVLLLPVCNVSIEELARYLYCELEGGLADMGLSHFAVTVSETSGQQATWKARPGSPGNPQGA